MTEAADCNHSRCQCFGSDHIIANFLSHRSSKVAAVLFVLSPDRHITLNSVDFDESRRGRKKMMLGNDFNAFDYITIISQTGPLTAEALKQSEANISGRKLLYFNMRLNSR